MAASMFDFESDISEGGSPLGSPMLSMSSPMTTTVLEAEQKIMLSFLQHTTCYEVMAQSGKIVVLDHGLMVKTALRAMRENNIVAAPLWDAERRIYSGMLTVTDWIDLLLTKNAAPETTPSGVTSADLGDMTLREVRALLADRRPPHLIYSGPEDPCLSVIRELIRCKIHRMPIVCPEENTILSVLTHRLILRHLNAALFSTQDFEFLSTPIDSLPIGTWTNLITCTPESKLIDVLVILSTKKISTIPVVDARGKIIDLYSKSEVMTLSRRLQPLEALQETIGAHLQDLRSNPIEIPTCSKRDPLERIFSVLLSSRSHRVFCVDAEGRFEGVISFFDILVLIIGPQTDFSL